MPRKKDQRENKPIEDYETHIQREFKITKSNMLVQRARFTLTAHEQKILAFCFSKIKPTDTELKPVVVSFTEYCKLCGLDPNSGGNSKNIKASIKNLRDKSFWLTEEDGTENLIGWLSRARLRNREGKIELQLDPELTKHLIALYGNFTQLSFLSELTMRSGYSIRLYELLKSYTNIGYLQITPEELRRLLACEQYVNFKDLRNRVLDIATKEINSYATDITITWQPIRKGKGGKVIRIDFTIYKRDSKASRRAQINDHLILDNGV